MDISNNIYKLKMEFGQRATLYKVVYGSTDWTTGKRTTSRTKVDINRLVILPIKTTFMQTIVQTGGFVQADIQEALLDSKDLPLGYKLEDSDYFVVNGRRYNITYFTQLRQGYYFHVQETNKEPPYQILDVYFKERLVIGENHAR